MYRKNKIICNHSKRIHAHSDYIKGTGVTIKKMKKSFVVSFLRQKVEKWKIDDDTITNFPQKVHFVVLLEQRPDALLF